MTSTACLCQRPWKAPSEMFVLAFFFFWAPATGLGFPILFRLQEETPILGGKGSNWGTMKLPLPLEVR